MINDNQTINIRNLKLRPRIIRSIKNEKMNSMKMTLIFFDNLLNQTKILKLYIFDILI